MANVKRNKLNETKRGLSVNVDDGRFEQAFRKFKKNHSLKNSIVLYKEILSLPFYPNISKKLQDYVINCIIDASVHR